MFQFFLQKTDFPKTPQNIDAFSKIALDIFSQSKYTWRTVSY